MVGNLLASSGLFFFAACSDAGLTEPRAQAGAGGAAMTRTSSTVTISSGSTTTSSGTTIVSTSSTSSSSSTGTQGDTARVTLTVTPTTTATFQVNVHRVRIVAGSICEPATSGYGVGTWDAPCKPAAGPVVSFSPDVRFVPGKINTIWLMDPKAALQKADPLTWCPAGATTCVNEAQSDPSLATTYTSDGYATRRIKHFSGFTVGFGAW
jgi:hypothetical protein